MEGYVVAPISQEKHCATLRPAPVIQPEVSSSKPEESKQEESHDTVSRDEFQRLVARVHALEQSSGSLVEQVWHTLGLAYY